MQTENRMNQGFLSRAFDKPIKDDNYNSENNRIFKLIMKDKGVPFHVKWLTDLNSSLPLRVHFPNIICNRMYSDSIDCVECEKVTTYKGVSRPNTPKTVWSLIGYVYDLVDTVYVSKKTGKEYQDNPIKIIEISGGKGAINFENLEQYHNSGILKDDVWIIKRLPEGGFDKPSVANLKLLGKQFNPTVPSSIEDKFNSMSVEELRGIIFSSYENAKFDHPDIKEAGIAKPSFLNVSEVSENQDPLD